MIVIVLMLRSSRHQRSIKRNTIGHGLPGVKCLLSKGVVGQKTHSVRQQQNPSTAKTNLSHKIFKKHEPNANQVQRVYCVELEGVSSKRGS
jgi:hypothetical protein